MKLRCGRLDDHRGHTWSSPDGRYSCDGIVITEGAARAIANLGPDPFVTPGPIETTDEVLTVAARPAKPLNPYELVRRERMRQVVAGLSPYHAANAAPAPQEIDQ